MTFTGWNPAALEFFAELEANNTKEWWITNRGRYDELVYAPMAAFGEAVDATFGKLNIKRPNRDIRFSTDKSPYKTTIAGGIDTGGGTLLGLQLSTEGLGVVAGHFEFAPDQLERFRDAIDDSETGPEFERLKKRLETNGYPLRSFSRLKSVPKGFPKDHPRAELLSFKGIHLDTQFGPRKLPKTVEAITKTWSDAKPFLDFLEAHVGPSAMKRF
jgi:uncharacterized protein (TIGR02453 family)